MSRAEDDFRRPFGEHVGWLDEDAIPAPGDYDRTAEPYWAWRTVDGKPNPVRARVMGADA